MNKSMEQIIELLVLLSSDERKEIFSCFCSDCGGLMPEQGACCYPDPDYDD